MMSHKVPRVIYSLALLFSVQVIGIEIKSSYLPQYKQAVQKQELMAGVELMLVGKEGELVVSPSYQFKSGDQFRIRLRSSVDSDYSLYILDEQGQKVKSQAIKGHIRANAIALVPSVEMGVLALNGKPGVEWLQLEVQAKGSLDEKDSLNDKPAKLLSKKHPNGKIEQIVLRNVELQAPIEQQVQYDAVNNIIYFSRLKATKMSESVSLKLGLTHSK